MDDRVLFQRMHASLGAFYRVVARGAPDSRVVEYDGLISTVVPSAPDRSFPNSVVYERADQLARSLDALTELYERAGVRAWTVWVPESDRDSAALLEERGHVLDADPAAMALELASFARRPAPDVAIDTGSALADLARINDVAYGYEGDFVRTVGELPADALHLYVTPRRGKAVACAAALDHERDCCVTFVATLPEARGRGLATELMTRALVDARERGCGTTSLQATKAGQPIYERLGYRNLGALQMWERRRAAS